MSGHSKWKQIKRQKAVVDAKRGAVFTRFGRNLTMAARGGGDPATNFKLATAIEQARSVNMPKDNIERAIAKGTGAEGGGELHETLYEGYGPAGVAILIQTVTDNVNRTVSEVRHCLQKHGGTLATSNAVKWNFEQKGVIRLESAGQDREALELSAIDAGADDIKEEEDSLTITTEPKNLQHLKESLAKEGVKSEYAEVEYAAKNTVSLNEADSARLDSLMEALNELEDVNDCYTNAE